MGQLERYGLYVLCLVIFLILGVAIWGGDPQPPAPGGDDLTSELERLSSPIAQTPDPEPGSPGNVYIGEYLDLNNEVPRDTDPPAAQTRIEEAAATPPAPPAANAVVERSGSGEERYYEVQQGDMLTEISKRELGQRSRWKEILALNPGVEEKNLKVGMKLRLPPRRATSPEREWFLYTVRKNDNYSTISDHLYGTKKYWQRIRDLNPGQDPMKLRPGTQIRVPYINS